MTEPLVTVGILTYNRVDELKHCVGTALAQDYPNLQVVVSDDQSSDGTEQFMRALAAEDERVKYVRQPQNVGHALNFNRTLEAADGEYFMWLSDDDWLDPGYVSRCLAELRGDPSLLGVCGRGHYYRDGRMVTVERPMNLLSRRPAARVLRYFGQVSLNGVLYSVMRREDVARHGFPNVLGGDWLLMGKLAACGGFRTLDDVAIHRSIEGRSDPAHIERLVEGEFGIGGRRARNPHAIVAATLFRAIGREEPEFARLGPVRRRVVAAVCAGVVAGRYVPALKVELLLWRVRRALGRA